MMAVSNVIIELVVLVAALSNLSLLAEGNLYMDSHHNDISS